MRLLVIVAVLMLSLSTARAGDPAGEADELIKQGFQLRLQGKNAEALDRFSWALAISPSGKTFAQMGVTEVALGRWIDAEVHLQAALARHDSPWTEAPKNREMLEKSLADAQKQIARVRLAGTQGTEVFIDGKRIGSLPISDPIHVAAGTIHLRATAVARVAIEKDLIAKGGEETTVSVDLPFATPVPAATPAAVLAVPAPVENRRPTWRTWTGAALGAAGLAAVGTGIGWLVVDGRPTCSPPSGTVCQKLYDTKTQGWVAVGIGAAAAVGGATLMLWPGHTAASGQVGLNVGPRALGLAGTF